MRTGPLWVIGDDMRHLSDSQPIPSRALPLDAAETKNDGAFMSNKKAVLYRTALKRQEEGNLREGDARRRSALRNARYGQVGISGRGKQTSVSMASFIEPV